jgi:hypothetical protein
MPDDEQPSSTPPSSCRDEEYSCTGRGDNSSIPQLEALGDLDIASDLAALGDLDIASGIASDLVSSTSCSGPDT